MIQYLNKNQIALAIVAAGIIIGGVYFYINQETVQGLSAQEAADKAIAFINQTVEENVTASLLDVSEEAGLYKVHLKIGGTEYNSYITKDGKFLFPNAFNLEEQIEEVSEISQEEKVASEDFAKCLTGNGMKFYGSKNCGWCKQQKESFGDSLQYVVYIECVDPETEQWSEECKEAGISAVPTWLLPDGEMSTGFKPLESLAEISGCPLE